MNDGTMDLTLYLNGATRKVTIQSGEHLSDTLRGLGCTGVKRGCGEGTCGSCAVLLNGRLVTSCTVFSATTDGSEITTIEGLGTISQPHPIQQAFVNAGAIQCGFCTPGMVLAAKALLDRTPNPTEDQIKLALDGNLCRCTGYVKIIEAVKEAATLLQAQSKEEK